MNSQSRGAGNEKVAPGNKNLSRLLEVICGAELGIQAKRLDQRMRGGLIFASVTNVIICGESPVRPGRRYCR